MSLDEYKVEELGRVKEKLSTLDSEVKYLKERFSELLNENRAGFEKIIGQIERVDSRLEAINSLNHKVSIQENVLQSLDKALSLITRDLRDIEKYDDETRRIASEVRENLKIHERVEDERVKTVGKTMKTLIVAGQLVAGGIAFLVAWIKNGG